MDHCPPFSSSFWRGRSFDHDAKSRPVGRGRWRRFSEGAAKPSELKQTLILGTDNIYAQCAVKQIKLVFDPSRRADRARTSRAHTCKDGAIDVKPIEESSLFMHAWLYSTDCLLTWYVPSFPISRLLLGRSPVSTLQSSKASYPGLSWKSYFQHCIALHLLRSLLNLTRN